MGRQAAQAPWLIGAMVLGVLAASKDPNAANAAIAGGQAAAAQNQLNFPATWSARPTASVWG